MRVDVPALEAAGDRPPTQGFTKLYGQGAIYSIGFVDRAAALMIARGLRIQPVGTYELRQALRTLPVTGRESPPDYLEEGDRPF